MATVPALNGLGLEGSTASMTVSPTMIKYTGKDTRSVLGKLRGRQMS